MRWRPAPSGGTTFSGSRCSILPPRSICNALVFTYCTAGQKGGVNEGKEGEPKGWWKRRRASETNGNVFTFTPETWRSLTGDAGTKTRELMTEEGHWQASRWEERDERMDGWMDGWMDRGMDGWMDRGMDGWTEGWIEVWMEWWIEGWMEWWIEGWMDG